MKNYMHERYWALRDAVTDETYLTQENEPEFNPMTEIYGDRECYWAFEWVEEEVGPPYDAATRTGMYDYW